MSYEQPQALSPDDWLNAFVPLGALDGQQWTSCGAGVLLLDNPLVWLFTTKTVVAATGSLPLAAWVPDDQDGTIVDLTTDRSPETGWLAHPTADLIACLFPVDPKWRVKAFVEARCFPTEDLQPLLPVASMGCAYGLTPLTSRPRPLVLSGNVASCVDGVVITTAPLLPRNSGAPLLVPLPPQAGGGVALAGISTATLSVPESVQSTAPPVRLTSAVPISAALGLIRSNQGKAQRKAALAKA